MVADAPGEGGDRQLPADAGARRLRRPAGAHRPRQPRLRRDAWCGGLEIRDAGGGHPDVVVAGRPATIAVDVTEVAAGDGVPADDRQQPRPAGRAPSTARSPRRSTSATASWGRGSSARSSALPLLPGRYRIDVIVKGKRQIQDGLQAAAFFDVEPGIVGERPTAAGRPTATSSSPTPGGCRHERADLLRSSSPPTKPPRRSAAAVDVGAGADAPRRGGDRRRRRLQRRPRRRARPFGERIDAGAQENGGGAAARNTGAAAATADFIAVLDADDAYHPRRLEAIAELAGRRPELDLITTDARLVVDGRSRRHLRRATPPSSRTTSARRSSRPASSAAGRRSGCSRLRAIGGFDESCRIAYDWDCWLRMILDGAARRLRRGALLRLRRSTGQPLRQPRAEPLGAGAHAGEGGGGPNAAGGRAPGLERALRSPQQAAGGARPRRPLHRATARIRAGAWRDWRWRRGIRPSARARAALAVAAPGLACRRLSAGRRRRRDARFKDAPG